jgi:hypothetical protein
MKKVVLLFASVTLVAWLFPPVCQGRSIQPPRCCNWNETTSSAQAVSNQGVTSISDRISSSPEALSTEQNMLSSGVSRERSPLENLEVFDHLYVPGVEVDLRMSFLKGTPPDLNWASS